MYYDSLWHTVLRYLGGVHTDERARQLAALSGNNVSLLDSAGALVRGQPETPERKLALSRVDLAELRARRLGSPLST